MWWGDMGSVMGSGWGMLGILHMALWWILIVLGIVVLVKWLAGSGSGQQGGTGRPLDIHKERYARGEIDREEFEQRKRDILT
jgi:putative membrane protein